MALFAGHFARRWLGRWTEPPELGSLPGGGRPVNGRFHKEPGVGQPVRCIAFRRTTQCDPNGPLKWQSSKTMRASCKSWFKEGSGYCECTRGLATQFVGCGRHYFSCEKECERLEWDRAGSRYFPHPLQCNADNSRPLLAAIPGNTTWDDLVIPPTVEMKERVAAMRAVYDDLGPRSFSSAPHGLTEVPERTFESDFVADGWRMGDEDLRRAQDNFARFMGTVPAYPEGAFAGWGIAMLAGGLKYTPPALWNIIRLRKTGSTLPVEMFFLPEELPPQSLVDELKPLGVTCRKLPHLSLPKDMIGRFSNKPLMLLASSFEEVLLLDSDSLPMQDPEVMFEDRHYKETGNYFFPDYWYETIAPDFYAIMNVTEGVMGRRTCESGQIFYDKRRGWEALQATIYMNLGSMYARLLTNYMGQGDKETFPAGFKVLGLPTHMSPHDTGSAGRLIRTEAGREKFSGNTMIQYAPDGSLLFLHVNFEKELLRLPENFNAWTRRWDVYYPGGLNFREATAWIAEDLERDTWHERVHIRCSPGFKEYATFRQSWYLDKFHIDLVGFHTAPEGMVFIDQEMEGTHRGWFEAQKRVRRQ